MNFRTQLRIFYQYIFSTNPYMVLEELDIPEMTKKHIENKFDGQGFWKTYMEMDSKLQQKFIDATPITEHSSRGPIENTSEIIQG